jgi:hypothetical protein
MRFAAVMLLAVCTSAFAAERSVIVVAGEGVHFGADGQPQFTAAQMRNSAAATRNGLVRWSGTAHGRALIAYFAAAGNSIDIIEDEGEEGIGRAPQPGIATLAAAADRSKQKTYELVLNPRSQQPATPGDLMSAAWAGEMLHIYFYSQGISLPHHQRADFQREWRAVAAELGMPALTHEDADESRPQRARVIVLRSSRW